MRTGHHLERSASLGAMQRSRNMASRRMALIPVWSPLVWSPLPWFLGHAMASEHFARTCADPPAGSVLAVIFGTRPVVPNFAQTLAHTPGGWAALRLYSAQRDLFHHCHQCKPLHPHRAGNEHR